MRIQTRVTIIAGLMAAYLGGAEAASASAGAAPDAIAGAIGAVAVVPDGSTRVSVHPGAQGFTATGAREPRLVGRGQPAAGAAPALQIAIPGNDAGQVTLGRPGSRATLAVGLPSTGARTRATLARDGTVTYAGHITATDVAVQAFSEGVRVQTVIAGPTAPTEFAYPVRLPAGGHLAPAPDGGILVLDAGGLPVGGFAAPWAKDATGKDIPTRYEIRGDVVVQDVAHAGAAAYPVIADPWMWIDLIKHADWRYDSKNHGWTLMVTPTRWARLQAGGYLPGVAGWKELYSKYKNRGLNRNLGGMRDQYICHQQIVALRSPNKPTWNLDEWRKDVSYAQTVLHQCNPGAPSIFD